ncbi:MAG: protein-L-isoaspartate(D-aspartate) O-methyltransferase [Longimicrobiales bacterium]
MIAFAEQRRRMVEHDLAKRGILDSQVLEAMLAVPRERFVPPQLAEFAYDDSPLPIAEGQTISQPFIVALMTEALELEGGERVLEIGTGSGYAAAVLSRIVAQVYSVERHGPLAREARTRLQDVGYDNVRVLHADGTEGWAEHGPYDAIIVAAGGPEVPQPLLDQLAPHGRLVIPVGETTREQTLLRVRNDPVHGFVQEDLGTVRFVPLIGAKGWVA